MDRNRGQFICCFTKQAQPDFKGILMDVAERYRNFFMSVSAIATDADYKHIYEGLISGDPKMRAFRALYQRIYGRYISDAKKGERHG